MTPFLTTRRNGGRTNYWRTINPDRTLYQTPLAPSIEHHDASAVSTQPSTDIANVTPTMKWKVIYCLSTRITKFNLTRVERQYMTFCFIVVVTFAISVDGWVDIADASSCSMEGASGVWSSVLSQFIVNLILAHFKGKGQVHINLNCK